MQAAWPWHEPAFRSASVTIKFELRDGVCDGARIRVDDCQNPVAAVPRSSLRKLLIDFGAVFELARKANVRWMESVPQRSGRAAGSLTYLPLLLFCHFWHVPTQSSKWSRSDEGRQRQRSQSNSTECNDRASYFRVFPSGCATRSSAILLLKGRCYELDKEDGTACGLVHGVSRSAKDCSRATPTENG
jgi:hypothetical protein